METTSSEDVLDVSTVSLAKKLAELRGKKQVLDAQVNEVDAEIDQVKLDLTTRMEETGMRKFQVAGLGTFYLQASFYPKIVGDKDELIAWLDNGGASEIAPRTVSVTRLREFYEERLEKDLPVPPINLVDATSQVSVRFRQSKGK